MDCRDIYKCPRDMIVGCDGAGSVDAWVVVFAAWSGLITIGLGVACLVPSTRKYMHHTRAGALLQTLLRAQPCSDDSENIQEVTQLIEGAHSLAVAQGPQHLAIIMDGNRRYGKKYHNNSLRGHTDGADTLVKVIDWCADLGVEMLTVYALSTENWNRPRDELETLMKIFESYSDEIRVKAMAGGIRVNLLASDPELLPKQTYERLKKLVNDTAGACIPRCCIECVCAKKKNFTLNLCVSYGARSEIVGAAKALAQAVLNGEISIDEIDERQLNSKLLTWAFPDPDLMIRTAEARLSNFLLWQLAYTEIQFLDKLWPEVTQQDIRDAIEGYAKKKRRFGK